MADAATSTNLWAPYVPATSTTTDTTARTPNNALDKDAFLKLLIAQMKYQDPLSPMDDKEFLAQMAQFTSLEQIQNLNKTAMQSQAYAMIGKTVYANYANAAGVYEEVTGLVSAVSQISNEIYVTVDGKDIPLSAVTVVGDDYFTASQLNAIFESVASSRDINMIGKYIQAIIASDGVATEFVEGEVSYVRFNGTEAVLMVGDKEIFVSEVATVADKPLLLGQSVNARVLNDDGEYETIENGTIESVLLENEKAYLIIDGTKVPLEKINYATEALRYIGQTITYPGYSGTVESITMKNGIPYFDIDGQQLAYTDYKNIASE